MDRFLNSMLLSALVVLNSGCATDDGVSSRCGNGVLDADEICEGFELREATCVSEGFSAGRLRCNDRCEIDVSQCSRCGDGEITAGEVCEPSDLGGETCASIAGPGSVGQLGCSPDCTEFVAVGCRQEIPSQAFTSCDPDASVPCATTTLNCLALSNGHFCMESCDVANDRCGKGRFCHDLDGQGICVDIPNPGEICTPQSGCGAVRHECLPTFNSPAGQASVCARPCPANLIGTGTGCGVTGEVCVAVPGGQVERESSTPCSVDASCDMAAGYTCRPTSDDGSLSSPVPAADLPMCHAHTIL